MKQDDKQLEDKIKEYDVFETDLRTKSNYHPTYMPDYAKGNRRRRLWSFVAFAGLLTAMQMCSGCAYKDYNVGSTYCSYENKEVK